MIVKFPNQFAPGSLAHALADLDMVTPADAGYGVFAHVPSRHDTYSLPRNSMSDWLKTDEQLLTEQAVAELATGKHTLH